LILLFAVFVNKYTPISTYIYGAQKEMTKNEKLKLQLRASADRGHADHGWLKGYHSFSFADYYDKNFDNFGPLRVINEDRIAPGQGFGTHPHREFEIWTYVLAGELTHKDSMGNVEVIKRGEVQHTSAGTGISHSEYNMHKDKWVHSLQIWAKPSVSRLPPAYYLSHHTDESKRDVLKAVILPRWKDAQNISRDVGAGPIPIPADIGMWASILTPGKSVTHTFADNMGANAAKNRSVYVHLTQTSRYQEPNAPRKSPSAKLRVNGELILEEGDAALVRGCIAGEKLEIECLPGEGSADAEFVLFDLVE